jgi:integrase
MSNNSRQENRGRWRKKPSERGVFQRGKSWYIRYTDQRGKLHVEVVGPSKSLALKAYQIRKASVTERRFVPASGVLFDELVEDVVAVARRRHDLTRPDRTFKPGNERLILKWFKGRKAESIASQEIAARLNGAKTPATFNRLRVCISHAFKLGIQHEKISKNPATIIKLVRENNERIRYLNQHRADEEATLRVVLRDKYPEREPELDLALHSGLRWSEQYELTWANVDLERGEICITKGKGSGRVERIPINSCARAALLKLRALTPNSALVCPRTITGKIVMAGLFPHLRRRRLLTSTGTICATPSHRVWSWLAWISLPWVSCYVTKILR